MTSMPRTQHRAALPPVCLSQHARCSSVARILRRRAALAGARTNHCITLCIHPPLFPQQEVLAAKLRLAEKQILAATMDAVRRRLAPIRGIPTKQGMQRQDADLFEIFDTLVRARARVGGRASCPSCLLRRYNIAERFCR